MKQRLLNYFKSDKHYWWTVSLLPGVYCILYLYTNNFTLLNSWVQIATFLLMFVALPAGEILFLDWVFKKWFSSHRDKLYWFYLILNFAIIQSWCIYMDWHVKALILGFAVALLGAIFVAQHYKKVILLLFLMTLIAGYQFAYFYIERVMSHEEWAQSQPFENLKFEKKPNIYLIQPDGFVGKPAAESDLYQLDLDNFYSSMEANGFDLNHDYRSNYHSTLTSNATLFTGQHHFFEMGNMDNELYGARQTIVGSNPVLRTLKNNGYQTHLILHHRYLLLNHPDLFYDTCNISPDQLSNSFPEDYLNADYFVDLKRSMTRASSEPQFYFVEILNPAHIPGDGVEDEQQKYATEYKERAMSMAQEIIAITNHISAIDPQGIIIIAADHGGYLGFYNTSQLMREPTIDPQLKASVFSSLFAVKAPADFSPYQDNISSAIGVFPNLFQYLAQRPAAVVELDNSSYMFINAGEDRGVYKYYTTNGVPLTERLDP